MTRNLEMRSGPVAVLRGLAICACAGLAVGCGGGETGSDPQRDRRVQTLDGAARDHVAEPMVAGVSVAVVHKGDTLLMAGYGHADLEWDVPTPEDGSASYEIGSVTKQFTAAAVLGLAADGRLDLDADLRDYLPDYDTQGYEVPLRRLLDHTSGIKGYTEMEAFGEVVTRSLPRDSLVTLFEAEPFEFEPGAALIYNNSAYFLLGLIIEQVAGQSYGDYVREALFEPAGMDDSSYCSNETIRPGRAHGYDGSPDGLVLKAYLDHQWPYAAGSLCSTVGDLIAWNQALHGGRLLDPEWYEAMTTPAPLEDGTPTRYAMGLGRTGQGRFEMIRHGGGINGFLSDAVYLPAEDLTIVVLQNSTGPVGPGDLIDTLVEAILGPTPEPEVLSFGGDIDDLTGLFSGPARGRGITVEVTRDGDDLTARIVGEEDPVVIQYLGDGVWSGGQRIWRFSRDGGRITHLQMDSVGGLYVLERTMMP